MKSGIELIHDERHSHQWSAHHDDGHGDQALAIEAAHLLVDGTDASLQDPCSAYYMRGRWGLVSKHEGNRIRQLMIAGALVAAEIDRLQRLTKLSEDE